MRLVKIALITLAVCIVIPVIIFGLFYIFPKPIYSIYSFGQYIVSPKYKETTSIDGGSVWYQCSKTITVRKQFKLVGHLGGSVYHMIYWPVNESDLKKFCHITAME